jgi:predicted glycoside hydrolase/deacetylase ChbG (UPF0249 family)
MATRPHWRALAPALRAFDGRADIGLHLDLTLGPSLGKLGGLGRTDRLPPVRSWLGRGLAGRIDIADLRAEIGRQLDAFEAEFGRPPDYVDGHQHVHVLPGVRRAFLDELEARGLAGRVWLRDSADDTMRIVRRRREAGKALIVSALAAGFAAEARRRGFRLNSGFSGFSDFDPKDDYAAAFQIDSTVESREVELAFLLSEAFRETLERKDAHLVRMSDLLRSA